MLLLTAVAFGLIGKWGQSWLTVPTHSDNGAWNTTVPAAESAAPTDFHSASKTTAAVPAERAVAHPFRAVLIALVAILLAARIFGWLFVQLGQPRVIGEVIAGIALGPSCLGSLWPEATLFLLPPTITPLLGVLAQMGVILYMFLVGLELNFDSIKSYGRESLLIAHASIAAPFVLGALLATLLYEQFAGEGVPFTTFAMFLGVALSITALPVLARIIADRGIGGTRAGALALSCAAADDATAWCLLAVVVGFVGTQLTAAFATWIFAGMFVAVMLFVVRPILAKLLRTDTNAGPSSTTVALLLVALIVSSLATDLIGIHAIFGAFLLGAIIPHDSKVAQALGEKLEDVARALLLPAFFALTGLRTKIGLLDGFDQWLLCGLIVLVATAGKLGGTALAARYCGLNWRTSAELGALMNTRGLVEIIVLDIGLQLGVITPPLFAMMVVMAVATTLMTGPLLSAIGRCFGQPSQRQEQDARPALPLKASIASKSAAVA